MKNIFSLLLLALIFVSCENDVKTNTPAFQGEKDNLFWRAGDSRVTVNSNGTITLNGYTDYEVISVTVPNAVGTYDLGTANNSNFASYSYNNEGTVLYYNQNGLHEGLWQNASFHHRSWDSCRSHGEYLGQPHEWP